MAKSIRTITVLLAATTVAFLIVGVTLGIANSQSSDGNYDTDGDGLIEISYLEQLNAIRYDLDGDGRPDANGAEAYAEAFPDAEPSRLCPNTCNGYELARPLDFKDAGSYSSGIVNTKWTSGIGWLPIGFLDDPFITILEGNGHTITGLYIDRTTPLNDPGQAGLFGVVGQSSVIRAIGMLDVDVTGVHDVGGLVGRANAGTITASYVTGSLSGDFWRIGGLAGSAGGSTINASYATANVSGLGWVGGLVGDLRGSINNSYSSGMVSGDRYAGGLVGENHGSIFVSYSASSVSGRLEIGGLVGRNPGTVMTGYSTGSVSGEEIVGGLIGNNSGTVMGSFWNTRTSGQGTGIGTGRGSLIRGRR